MGADNWAKCPRCLRQGELALANLKLQVDASYGVVSVEVFDQKRAVLVEEQEKLEGENTFRTWRESWRIEGAEDGVVEIHYSGSCNICKLQMEFTEDHPIPGL